MLLIFGCLLFAVNLSYGQCSIDPTRPGPQEGDWYRCPPGYSPGLGFPGNPNPIPLQEVVIRPEQTQNNGYPFFPAIPSDLPPGWSVFVPKGGSGAQVKIPCPGDPFRNPTIAPSSPGNIKGGTFGNTRNGGTKFHDGTDISAEPNTPLYSMYSGQITDVRSSFQPDEYAANSYGNYVEIKSTINGQVVYLKYNHLNGVGADVKVGTQVTQGQTLGITGTTGNAADPHVLNKHLHIQAKDADHQKIDPEPFISTKFDKSTGKGNSPC